MTEVFPTPNNSVRTVERLREGGIETRISDERGTFEREKGELRKDEKGVEQVDPLQTKYGPAMSDINEQNKESHKFEKCTGLVMRGRTHDGRHVSFMLHQVPTWNDDFSDVYRQLLGSKIQDLAAQVVPGSLDAVFFGGEVDEGSPEDDPMRQWYKEMKDLVFDVVRHTALIETRLVDKPKPPGWQTFAFLDNRNGILYLEHDKIPLKN